MELFSHPFLIRLFATYKDKNRLYFLLEPSLGGELFSVLRERTLFDEPTAQFYAASVLVAFEYMHSMNIIYRDLKVSSASARCSAPARARRALSLTTLFSPRFHHAVLCVCV